MKELGTLFLILVVGALAWCVLPLLIPGPLAPKEAVQIAQPHLVDYHAIARKAASSAGIDPDLFLRQIQQESGFQTEVVSSAGAVGIAQILPSTAEAWNVDPHDPEKSLQAAARVMSYYLQRYGGYAEALACYNAGCSAMIEAKGRCGAYWRACLPAETQAYVARILGEGS